MKSILSSKWGKMEICAGLFGLISFLAVFLALTISNTNLLNHTAQAQGAPAASVTTDKVDYAAGEMAIITGSGWEPGESVALEIVGNPPMSPDAPPDTLYSIVDETGSIYNEYIVPGHGVDQTFTLTATGMSSVFVAQTTFTNILNSASPPSPETTPTELATVMTDKSDYAPGETVQITGSGWEPGETVELFLIEEPLIHEPETLYAIADESGNIYAEYVIQDHDLGQTFTLTATGLTSLLTAQTTFTDQQLNLFADAGFTMARGTFERGDTVYAKATSLNITRAYRFRVLDKNGTLKQTSTCQMGIVPAGLTDSYTIQPGDPLSDSDTWTYEVQEFTASSGLTALQRCNNGTPVQDDDDQDFFVAKAFAFATMSDAAGCISETEPTTCDNAITNFNTCQTVYIRVLGFLDEEDNVRVTWIRPGVLGNACSNTGGSDRPESDDDGRVPDNGVASGTRFLRYPPLLNTDSQGQWNNGTRYNGGSTVVNPCTAADPGSWQVRLQNEDGDSDETVDLNAFTLVTCNDSNTCTDDTCNAANGQCVFTPDDTNTCSDNNTCTQTDSCVAGVCVGSNPLSCDDSNVCNGIETCDPTNGCQAGTPLTCDDSNVCNGIETCDPTNGCQAGTPLSCDDSNVCNGIETCDPTNGCQAGTPLTCDDSNVCNGIETCDATNGCQAGTPLTCDDTNVCTVDTCNPATGCVFTPGNAGTVCNPGSGDLCDPDETCDGVSAACPADVIAEVTTKCNPGSGDVCDPDEFCTGVADAACPADVVAPATTKCNPGSGDVCDPDEFCTGVADAACPPDFVEPSTMSCRDAVSDCDAEEFCTGVAGADCPDDQFTSCLTNSSLCLFDVDESTDECDFRLIFTPDQNNPSAWKQNASNPGQFYYNVFYYGNGGETVDINVPYPFVTMGAVPIHIYDSVPSLGMCIEPGTEIANSDTQVTIADYTDTNMNGDIGFGDVFTIQVDVPDVTGTGFAYINIHLDYGYKGTNNYSKNPNNDAISASDMSILIPNMLDYIFSDSTGESDMCQNLNVFKHDPGIGGLVLESDGDPVANVKVQIYQGTKLMTTVYTDADGWYMWQYKYTGKPTMFTVKLPTYNKSQSVTLKSNGFLVVNFTVP